MFEIFQSSSDDQVALMGCAGALLASGFLMYISYFLGPVARKQRQQAMQRMIAQRQQLLEEKYAETPREKAA